MKLANPINSTVKELYLLDAHGEIIEHIIDFTKIGMASFPKLMMAKQFVIVDSLGNHIAMSNPKGA